MNENFAIDHQKKTNSAILSRGVLRKLWQRLPQGFLPLICWTGLIILGTWYPSTSVLKHFFEGGTLPAGLDTPTGWIGYGSMFVTAVLSWTWTNLVFLCLAAAYLGIAARPDLRTDDTAAWGQVLPRAFVIFLAFLFQELALRGSLIPSAERMTSGDAQQHYLRLAILSSIACFATSFRPAFFNSMVDKLIGKLEDENQRQAGTITFEPNRKREFTNSELTASDVAPNLPR